MDEVARTTEATIMLNTGYTHRTHVPLSRLRPRLYALDFEVSALLRYSQRGRG